MTAEHVNGLDVLFYELPSPGHQGRIRATVHRVKDQTGKEKVINGEPFARDFFVEAGAILGMNLRKKNKVVLRRDLPQSLQVVPRPWLVEEIALARFLV